MESVWKKNTGQCEKNKRGKGLSGPLFHESEYEICQKGFVKCNKNLDE